jgi:predicted small secreted protein
MICRSCNGTIEKERLEILPKTCVCSECAHAMKLGTPRKAFTVHSHKTGSEIQIVSASYFEDNKKYFIPQGGFSTIKNFSKSVCS